MTPEQNYHRGVLRKNPVEILLFILLLSGVFLGHIPRFTEPFIYIFSFSYFIFILAALYNIQHKAPVDFLSLALLLLLLVIMPVNLVIAYKNGTDLASWSRSALWVFCLILYPCLIMLSRTVSKANIFHLVVLSCFLWSVALMVFNFDAILSLLKGESMRLSHDTRQVFVPIALIGFTLLLFGKEKYQRHDIFYLITFFFIIIMAGYRSQLAMVVAFIVFKVKPWRSFAGLFSIISMTLLAIMLHGLFQFSFVTTTLSRFENIQEEKTSLRSREIDIAYQTFKESPVLGKGFGHQIPASAVRDESVEVESKGGVLSYSINDGINYIHNFTFYVLMCMGLSGYIFMVLPGLAAFYNIMTNNRNNIRYSAFMTILALMVYFHISASFKQPQTIALLSVLLFLSSPIGFHARKKVIPPKKKDIQK